jgi:hypothetical protein
MVDVLATLNFIWDVLKPAGVGALGDRLKRKSSTQAAAQKVLALYRSLEACLVAVDAFIDAFDQYVVMDERGGDVETLLALAEQSRRAGDRCEEVVHSLVRLTDAMAAVDPQLGLHKPEVVALLENFGVHEAMTLDHVPREIFPSQGESARDVLAQARHNRTLLLQAASELQTFIRTEFAFKELF